MNIEDKKQELQQDALRLKIRHSDKVFQLAVELEQDIQIINQKIKALEAEKPKK
jgi:hypothetical protein